jgi:hypothetical protein
MPALMDSAVLLGGKVAAAAPATKALHQLEASSQLDAAAPTPTASGALDDWQVLAAGAATYVLPGLLAGWYSIQGATSQLCMKYTSCSEFLRLYPPAATPGQSTEGTQLHEVCYCRP